MGAHDQRPRYYEGQFLSAADLGAAVDYQRAAQARHALAGHTWGIAAGLTLRERAAPGAPNRVEVLLDPGHAWDGFGRAITVERPVRVPEELLADVPFAAAVDAPPAPAVAKGRLLRLWIGYEETATRPPAPGFAACTDDAQMARVREGFRLYAGEFAALPERRSPLRIGTETVDAEEALRAFDPAAARVFDTSVPQQRLPADVRARWLVPLGLVRWVARDHALGHFVRLDLDPAERAADRARAQRRYIGVVAQNIETADGVLVVHRRDEDPLAPHRLATLLSGGAAWSDLRRDLLWVEGHARVGGNARLAGGALLLRNADGLDEGTPLDLARHGDGAPAAGGRELRAVIGPAAQYDNRWVVGPQLPGAGAPVAPRLVVTSGAGAVKKDAEGRVGVNTRDPRAALEVRGDWDGAEDGALRLGGASATLRWTHGNADTDPSWRAQVGANDDSAWRLGHRQPAGGWRDVLWAARSGRVGIGASAPTRPLAVRAQGDWHELVSLEDPAGATKWHLNMKALGNGPGNTPGLNFAETGVGDFRLFLKAGGDVGVGTMVTRGRLTVEGKVQPQQGQFTVFSNSADIEYDGGNDNLFVIRHANPAGAGVTALVGCRFGVGSAAPFGAMAVRAVGAGEELLSFEGPGGATTWHINQGLAGSPQRGLNFARTGVQDGRLFLAEGGNVGIGTTNPQHKLHVAGAIVSVNGAGNEQAYLGGDAVAADVQLGSTNAAIQRVSLWNTGGFRMDLSCRNVNASWVEVIGLTWVSDRRLKQRIAPIEQPLQTLARLRGVRFEWAEASGRGGTPDLGLVAQEVAEVLPELVHKSGDALGVSYLSLIPLLIESVKELQGQVDALRARLDERAVAAAPAAGPPAARRVPKRKAG